MRSLSVSDFKAHLSAYLREVGQGEAFTITEHRRPVAEVRKARSSEDIITYASIPFSLEDIEPADQIECDPHLARDLVNEDRGE